MKRYRPIDLKNHLEHLGVQKGDKLLVHSQLFSFGYIDGGVEKVYEALTDAVGSEGCLAFPSFTFSLSPRDVFSPRTRPDPNVGVLSGYVFDNIQFSRSLSPLHSYMICGADRQRIHNKYGHNSFGNDSIFHFFEVSDYKMLLLGCSFQVGATYIHHCEFISRVPYRLEIEIDRRVEIDNQIIDLQLIYFGRSSRDVKNSFYRVEQELENDGLLLTVPCTVGRSSIIRLNAMKDYVLSKLKIDPLYLLK
jgi:aminoglycoside 3-N-acetyltransferase